MCQSIDQLNKCPFGAPHRIDSRLGCGQLHFTCRALRYRAAVQRTSLRHERLASDRVREEHVGHRAIRPEGSPLAQSQAPRSDESARCGLYGNNRVDALKSAQASGLVWHAVFISRFPASLAERIESLATLMHRRMEASSQGESHMRRVAAFAGRTAASGFTTPLTSCAMPGLAALPHGGAQTSVQTPASAASRPDAQQPGASTPRSTAYPDPLFAPVVERRASRIASAPQQRGRRALSIVTTTVQTATRTIATQPASCHCRAA